MITLFNIANAIVCGGLALTCGIVGVNRDVKAFGVLGFAIIGMLNAMVINYCI